MSAREKWSPDRLAYTADQRQKIMACIQRLNTQESRALDRAFFMSGAPRTYLRQQIRAWYRERWTYLIGEYEKILPHVEELPDAVNQLHRSRALSDITATVNLKSKKGVT
jgi:hypothetical protein